MFELPEIVQIAAVCRSDLYLADYATLTFRYPPEWRQVDLGGRAMHFSME
jgi:hypothetical protein